MREGIRQILDKGKAENANSTERQEMFALFHRPENEFEVKEKLLEDLSAEATTISEPFNLNELFSRIWGEIEFKKKQNKTKSRYLYNVMKIAAAIIIGLFIGIYVTSIKDSDTITEPQYYVAHSPRGSISEMILPDGSVIFLNADSRIRYSLEGKNGYREVFLEGEAWFDVEKDENKPFIVHTPYYNVNVTGTQFNIKAYKTDKEVTTTLEDGQIIIESAGIFNMSESIILEPGEQAVLNKGAKEISVREVNPSWFTSWKDNKLIFVNMDLEELVVLLERKYGVSIDIKNQEILDLHFDGTIKNESIIEFLEIVKQTLPIDYKIVGQQIEIDIQKN